MWNHRLQITEYVFLAISCVGLAVAVVSGQLIYAAVPVAVFLLLNLINRQRLEHSIKRRINVANIQLYRQLSQELQALKEQPLLEKQPGHLIETEVTELEPSTLDNSQIQAQISSLEKSLSSVVQYLKSSSLPARVKHLEDAIATATAEITRINRQLPNTSQSKPRTGLKLPLAELQQHVEPTLPKWNQLYTLSGHSDWVSSLAITPDGQTLASASFDGQIKLWDVSTGELLHTLCEHLQGVLSLAITPDGQTLVSGSFDETIKLWNLDKGEWIDTLRGHKSSVRSLAITPDGQILISASFDQAIKLWHLERREFLGNLTEEAGLVSTIALTLDGQTLASGGSDGIICLWQLDLDQATEQPSPAGTLRGNLSSVCSLAISPDAQLLTAGCTDGNVKLWQLDTLELCNVFQGHSGQVMSVVFSPDGQTLISGSAGGNIQFWHLQTGKRLGSLALETTASVTAALISADGQLLAGGGIDGTIQVWQRN